MKYTFLFLFLMLFCVLQHASPEQSVRCPKTRNTCNKPAVVSVKVPESATVNAADVIDLTPVSILVLEI